MYPTENMLDAKAELAQLMALRERLVLGLAAVVWKIQNDEGVRTGVV